MKRHGVPVAVEGYAQWRDLIEAHPGKVYRNVLDRFRQGASIDAVDIEKLRQGLARLAARLHARLMGAAVLLAPTVPISPPPIADLVADDGAYREANRRSLRNTSLGNLLDLCAITLPCGDDGNGLPVGLMLMTLPRREGSLLRLASAVERTLAA